VRGITPTVSHQAKSKQLIWRVSLDGQTVTTKFDRSGKFRSIPLRRIPVGGAPAALTPIPSKNAERVPLSGALVRRGDPRSEARSDRDHSGQALAYVAKLVNR
jgi:hypothetical protein